MLKQAIKTIIADFHRQGIPELVMRENSILLNSAKIVTLIGPRRTGKTYMLYQLMKQIEDITNIIYINFEDERLTFAPEELQQIIEAYFEIYPEKKEKDIHIFFDEIQEIRGWEKFVRRIYDNITKKIFITGSSSKMLSKEIATSLRGRAISYEIYPLSFREHLKFKGVPEDIISTKGKAKIMYEFDNYLQRGGFPETVFMKTEVYNKTITNYFDTMLYRDVIERYSVTDAVQVRNLLKYLLSQTAKEFSINKIYNDFKSKGAKTSKDGLYKYLDYFEDAFILVPVANYSESVRKQTLRKAYAIDAGLANMLSLSLSKEHGRLFETIILLELKRRGKQVFYFKNGVECDFVIKEDEIITTAIQVCYDFNDENKEREIKGLTSAMKRFKLSTGTIITLNEQGKHGSINIVPAVNWLLEK
jgi:predicted AAA+ superfamily ATPase